MDCFVGMGGYCKGWEDKSYSCRRGLLRLLCIFYVLFLFCFFFTGKKGQLVRSGHTLMMGPAGGAKKGARKEIIAEK